jgi:hypothetical protein
MRPSGGEARLGRLAADLRLDGEQRRHALDGLARDRAGVRHHLVVEVAPGMRPARRLDHPAALVEGVEPGVGVGLHHAPEVAQATLRVLPLPVRRELVEHRGRIAPAERPIIPQVGPEPRRLRPALSRREHRHRRVAGMDPRPGQRMAADECRHRLG